MIRGLFTEVSSSIIHKELDKMKEAEPEEYEETIGMLLAAVEVGIHFLQVSPRFREGFAKIHNEFFKYPESRSTIEQAMAIVQEMKQE